MVQLSLQHVSLSLTLFSALSIAHPGHGGLIEEIAERSAYLKNNPRNVDHCASKLEARGVQARSLARRVAIIENLRDEVKMRKRSLDARQTPSASASAAFASGSAPPGTGMGGAMPSGGPGGGGMTQQNISTFGITVNNTSHLSTLDVSPNATDINTLIFGNTSCILNPEATIGPYYVSGEYIRSDISETQAGVPLYLDQQYVDVTTCDPIADLYADIWHCNATGVYAGIVSQGNGNSADASNINSTFLRGLQKTDSDGVVSWRTIFPGYYQGRTTHIHMVTHTDATELANSTVSGGNVTHIGQLMFDQDLTETINANVYPYTTNSQTITTNDEDSVFIGETLTDSDPVVNYVMLSDDIEDGLFAWITIGVDPSASYNTSAAAVLGEDGGYATGNSFTG